MKKGLIAGLIVICFIAAYIMLYANVKAYDPYALRGADTVSLSNRINGKLAISDTISKWWPKNIIPTDSIQVYNHSGRVLQRVKIWADTLSSTTGNGQSVDISSAGFTSVIGVSAIAEVNTGTSTSVSNIGVKSYSTSAVVLNTTNGNSSVVNILGNSVLLGPSNSFTTTSFRIHLIVVGY